MVHKKLKRKHEETYSYSLYGRGLPEYFQGKLVFVGSGRKVTKKKKK